MRGFTHFYDSRRYESMELDQNNFYDWEVQKQHRKCEEFRKKLKTLSLELKIAKHAAEKLFIAVYRSQAAQL